MSDVARLVVDDDGIILTADRAFAAIMHGRHDTLIGLDILAVTAPADRAKCAALFARLRADGTPVRTTKRLIRRDGTHVWVHARSDRAPEASEAAGAARYTVLVEPTTTPGEWVEPAHLLQLAEMIGLSRHIRSTVFSPSLFADQGWDILLRAYIAEAHGTILTIADLDGVGSKGRDTMRRWVRALAAEGLVEIEDRPAALNARADADAGETAIRLSTRGHARFERYLTDLFAQLTAMAPAPAG